MRPSFNSVFRRVSARKLLLQALQAEGRVDFPTVTDICEGVADDTNEMCAVAELLSTALQEGSSNNKEAMLSLHLKALTVIHELLYDASARQVLVQAPGLLSAIKRLHARHNTERQAANTALLSPAMGPALECIRLLTSEIYRSLKASFTCRL
jgi:hypothetical protein